MVHGFHFVLFFGWFCFFHFIIDLFHATLEFFSHQGAFPLLPVNSWVKVWGHTTPNLKLYQLVLLHLFQLVLSLLQDGWGWNRGGSPMMGIQKLLTLISRLFCSIQFFFHCYLPQSYSKGALEKSARAAGLNARVAEDYASEVLRHMPGKPGDVSHQVAFVCV